MAFVKIIIPIVVFLFALQSDNGLVSAKAFPSSQNKNLRLTPIGSVGQKGFFYDSLPRTWGDAESFCFGLDMKLVIISTADENNFLKTNSHLMSASSYWTAGRDVRTRQQYVWNNGGAEEQLEDLGNRFFADSTTRSCIRFVAGEIYGWWHGENCMAELPVLCQRTFEVKIKHLSKPN